MNIIIKRIGTAEWQGDLQHGRGRVSTDSNVLDQTEYSFSSRFKVSPDERTEIIGTNPEELIAAAQAACFSMALAAELSKLEISPKRISTQAVLSLVKQGDSFTISEIALDVEGDIPETSFQAFEDVANKAKQNCPVARALNIRITLRCRLAQEENAEPAA